MRSRRAKWRRRGDEVVGRVVPNFKNGIRNCLAEQNKVRRIVREFDAILADLQRILGIDPLLMGFGLERDTIHSPNESYLLRQLFAGMESIALFYQYY